MKKLYEYLMTRNSKVYYISNTSNYYISDVKTIDLKIRKSNIEYWIFISKNYKGYNLTLHTWVDKSIGVKHTLTDTKYLNIIKFIDSVIKFN